MSAAARALRSPKSRSMSRRVRSCRSSCSSWLMASGTARSHRGFAGTVQVLTARRKTDRLAVVCTGSRRRHRPGVDPRGGAATSPAPCLRAPVPTAEKREPQETCARPVSRLPTGSMVWKSAAFGSSSPAALDVGVESDHRPVVGPGRRAASRPSRGASTSPGSPARSSPAAASPAPRSPARSCRASPRAAPGLGDRPACPCRSRRGVSSPRRGDPCRDPQGLLGRADPGAPAHHRRPRHAQVPHTAAEDLLELRRRPAPVRFSRGAEEPLDAPPREQGPVELLELADGVGIARSYRASRARCTVLTAKWPPGRLAAWTSSRRRRRPARRPAVRRTCRRA